MAIEQKVLTQFEIEWIEKRLGPLEETLDNLPNSSNRLIEDNIQPYTHLIREAMHLRSHLIEARLANISTTDRIELHDKGEINLDEEDKNGRKRYFTRRRNPVRDIGCEVE